MRQVRWHLGTWHPCRIGLPRVPRHALGRVKVTWKLRRKKWNSETCPLANCKKKNRKRNKRKGACPRAPQPGLTSLAKAPVESWHPSWSRCLQSLRIEGRQSSCIFVSPLPIFSPAWLQALCKSGLPAYSRILCPSLHDLLY